MLCEFRFWRGKGALAEGQLRPLRSFRVWLRSGCGAFGSGWGAVSTAPRARRGRHSSFSQPCESLLFCRTEDGAQAGGTGEEGQSRWSSSAGRMKSSLCRQPCFPAADRLWDGDFEYSSHVTCSLVSHGRALGPGLAGCSRHGTLLRSRATS